MQRPSRRDVERGGWRGAFTVARWPAAERCPSANVDPSAAGGDARAVRECQRQRNRRCRRNCTRRSCRGSMRSTRSSDRIPSRYCALSGARPGRGFGRSSPLRWGSRRSACWRLPGRRAGVRLRAELQSAPHCRCKACDATRRAKSGPSRSRSRGAQDRDQGTLRKPGSRRPTPSRRSRQPRRNPRALPRLFIGTRTRPR